MVFTFAEYLANLTAGEPQHWENIIMYPLFIDGEEEREAPYLLLEEALESGGLTVSEVTREGSVNNIHVTNNGRDPVLILDGEELLGAKQNRMVNATVLIPPHMRIDIPVTCVERGRWKYDRPGFDQAGIFGYSSIRAQKSAQVAFSLKRRQEFTADQGALWKEIDRKQERMKVHSQTDALHEVYRNYEEELEKVVENLGYQPGQAGVAVFINGEFSCLDLFSFPKTLEALWSKLIKSYGMEALEVRGKAKGAKEPSLMDILQGLGEAETLFYPSVGMGTDLRIQGQGMVGAGLLVEDQVYHLSIFHSRGERNEGRMAGPSRRRRVYEQ